MIGSCTDVRFSEHQGGEVFFSGSDERDWSVTIPLYDFARALYSISPEALQQVIIDHPPLNRDLLPDIVKAIAAGAMKAGR